VRGVLALAAALLLISSPLGAQPDPQLPAEPAATASPDSLSRASVEAQLAELRAAEGLAPDARDAAIELYERALGLIVRAQEAAARAAEFRAAADGAPGRIESIREQLSRPAPPVDIQPPPEATVTQIEAAVAEASAELDAARRASADLQDEALRRDERRAAAPEQLALLRAELAETDVALDSASPESEPAFLTEARRTLQRAQRDALAAEIAALEAEGASYEARRDLLPLRRDLAKRRVAQAEDAVSAWQTILAERRQQEARQAAREAERLSRQAAREHPVLSAFAQETAERAAQRAEPGGLTAAIDQAARETEDRRRELLTLHQRFDAIERRINATGLNRATGLLLRRQFEQMPAVSEVRARVEATQRQLESAQFNLIELQEERLEMGDVDAVVAELLAQAPADQAAMEAVAREIALARRDLLDQLVSDSAALFDRLVELNAAERETLVAVGDYRTFIEERILWVRSVASGAYPTPAELASNLRWLTRGESWSRTLAQTSAYLADRWAPATIAALALLGLALLASRARTRLRELGDLVSRYRTDRLSHSVRALVVTLFLSAPIPLALALLGWTLRQPEEQPAVALAVGAGLGRAAMALFGLELLRHTFRSRGLAESHFRWPTPSIRAVRANLRWFEPIAATAVVVVAATEAHADERLAASLGRVCFTVGLVALSVFLYRTIRPRGPVLSRYIEENRSGWIARLRHVWAPLFIGLPLVVAALSWAGFHYTAIQLEQRLELTLALAFALVLVNGMLLRWLFIARRRVAIEDARRRRDQAAAQAQAAARSTAKGAAAAAPAGSSTASASPQAPSPAVSSDTVPAAIDEDKVDLPALSAQTRQLFAAAVTVSVVIGLFVIWAEALPALRMLDRIQLYPSVRVIETGAPAVMAPTPSPVAESAPPSPLSPLAPGLTGTGGAAPAPEAAAPAPALSLTVADLGLAIIVIIATVVAFRNVPGLVEIVVLQRLPLDAGSRYALSTVLRYSIGIIGIVLAFNVLGIAWGRVQWLAAALTFGLAFGLQEIFANFVSGLIILAERPVRLGDTVTVGGVSGTITRIRMRATTITDWDRKELIIPNKTFITGDVINWTLSDPVLRLTVPVGVSYSSDIDLVERLLLEVAREHPVVLEDPAPYVLFTRFGDSTLDHELRLFIPHIEHLIPVYHQLRQAIVRKFRAAGVEIAFPQRDLHIRSIGDLSKLVERRADLAETE